MGLDEALVELAKMPPANNEIMAAALRVEKKEVRVFKWIIQWLFLGVHPLPTRTELERDGNLPELNKRT